MSSVRFLSGGSSLISLPALGPVHVKDAYLTTASGWSDTIAAGCGEVITRIHNGSPESFARYVVGAPADVIEWLYTSGYAAICARVEELMSSEAGAPQTPVVRLARALNMDVALLAERLELAGVTLA